MRAVQNADGHVGLTAREYPCAAATALHRGQVVKLSGGLVISASANETGAILGIAAENHPGTADVLNPRANGTMILVYDSPELIFECPAPVFTASGGSATTVTAATSAVACTTADAFNGGFLKLVKKGSGSSNTDSVGKVKAITDFANADTVNTFTVPSGAAASSGDEFALFPPVGAVSVMALDSDTLGAMVASGSGCSKIRVVGHDTERGMLRLMAVEHALGVEN